MRGEWSGATRRRPSAAYLRGQFPNSKDVRDPMAAQYAYVMKDMTKSFPGAQKPVLSHINLQFYHGAKIGIVGPNGAGKSTLMKIMAGIDKEFSGRGLAGRECHRRLSAAGAAARPDQERP
jgi:ABC-type sugar transport system ATPase subunit